MLLTDCPVRVQSCRGGEQTRGLHSKGAQAEGSRGTLPHRWPLRPSWKRSRRRRGQQSQVLYGARDWTQHGRGGTTRMGRSKPCQEIQKQQQGTRAPEKLQPGRVPYQKQAPETLVSGWGTAKRHPRKERWAVGRSGCWETSP